MKNIKIQTFGAFRFFVDGCEIPISTSSKEFFALLVAAGGNKITAKDAWEFLVKPSGAKYNSAIYTVYFRGLQEELTILGIGDLLIVGHYPVRSCRIDITKVTCDYYELLNKQEPVLTGKASFLSGYSWAQSLCFPSWSEVNAYWQTPRYSVPSKN